MLLPFCALGPDDASRLTALGDRTEGKAVCIALWRQLGSVCRSGQCIASSGEAGRC